MWCPEFDGLPSIPVLAVDYSGWLVIVCRKLQLGKREVVREPSLPVLPSSSCLSPFRKAFGGNAVWTFLNYPFLFTVTCPECPCVCRVSARYIN